MKKILAIWSIVIPAVFISCSDYHDEDLLSGVVPVQFTPEVSSTANGAATRVVDNTWTGNEQIGIHMLKEGSTTLPTSAPFNTYKVTARSNENKNATLGPTATGQTLYYPVDKTNKVGFVAFSPYKAPSGNSVTYNAFTNQSEKQKMEDMDFIWCNTPLSYDYNSASVPLAFKHKFSKVIIHVNRDVNTVTEDQFKNLSLTMSGIPTTVSVPLNTGTPPPTSGSGVLTPYKSDDGKTSKTYMGIIAPCIAASRTVTFAGVVSSTYNYAITTGFESGKSYEFTFTLTQKGVVLTNTTVSNWGSGTVAWDGSYRLEVSENKIEADKSAIRTQFNFKTNWTASKPVVMRANQGTTLPTGDTYISWLTVETIQGSSDSYYTFSYELTANTGTSSRTAYIWITVGTMSIPITVTQSAKNADAEIDYGKPVQTSGESNCYILPPGGSQVLIPISRAYRFSTEYDTKHPKLSAGDAFFAEVLWSDVTYANTTNVIHANSAIQKVGTIGTGPYGHIYVQSGSKEGNAVVALKNSAGTILWSWHIWVTSYDPATTYKTWSSSGTYYFMDRHLGATATWIDNPATIGLLYQWGRKDPLPGYMNFVGDERQVYHNTNGVFSSKTLPISSTSTSIPMRDSVTQPFMFYKNTGDWCSDVGRKLRWQSLEEKTIDDPCPLGWQVSINQIWNGFITSDFKTNGMYGHEGEKQGYWPYSGNRSGASGALEGKCTPYGWGYIWCPQDESHDSAFSYRYGIGMGHVYPKEYKAAALSIRCYHSMGIY